MSYAQEKIMPYGKKTPKGKQVERMFDNIAHTYDALNHWLSLGIDRRWRRTAIDALKPLPHAELLDVATGTGDFALLACRRLHPQKVMAVDVSQGMMDVGHGKVTDAGLTGVVDFQREDCMALSFPDASFDAVTVAYGVRNFQNLDQGLREMRRVLRPGGTAVVVELSAPRRFPAKQFFWIYSHVMMPALGRIVSKDRRAYEYLPATMEVFPQGREMQEIMERCGYSHVSYRTFTFGLCTMYIATK